MPFKITRKRVANFPAYTKAGLPAAGSSGRIARVTDDIGGLWMDSGVQWVGPTQVDVRNAPFNVRPDDSTDNTTGLNLAFAKSGHVVWLPEGTIRYATTLAAPDCSAICGISWQTSILKPGAAVTKGLSISSTPSPSLLSDFQIDGAQATSLTGLVLGDGSVWGSAEVNRLWIRNCSVVGLHVADVVNTNINSLFLSMNGIGVLCQAISSSTPTTTSFYGLRCDTALTKGVKIVTGYMVKFVGSTIQSSGEQGVFIDATAGDSTEIIFDGCWFEDNYTGANPTQYQFRAASNGVHTSRGVIRDCYFSGNVNTARSIDLDGVSVAGWMLMNCQVPNDVAGSILIRNGAYGDFYRARNVDTSAILTDASDYLYDVVANVIVLEAGLWTAWIPTYASNIGNAAATFDGAVTTHIARYQLTGKTLKIQLTFSATLTIVDPAYISVTLPLGLFGSSNSAYTPAVISDNSIGEIGFMRVDVSNAILFYRHAGAPYTASGAISAAVTTVIEIQ